MCNAGGSKARDLLMLTVREEEEHRAYLVALLDRPMMVARVDAVVHGGGAAAAAAAAVAVTVDVRGGVRDVLSDFIECIGRLDPQRFKVEYSIMHACVCACIEMCLHADTHVCARTHTRTHAYTYTQHSHTHIHTC